MVRLITVPDIQKLIHTIGCESFFAQFIPHLEKTFSRWQDFQKNPRLASHFKNGVLELMPICDDRYYTFKFVNGHPNNINLKKLTVVATGMLAEVESGYPLMISEMTLLTALRTAATSALAAKYLARKNTKRVGIIGCGAQSEFQILAQKSQFNIDTVYYFDIDSKAMEKFSHNLKKYNFNLIACKNAQAVLENIDIITTATASKKQASILNAQDIKPGLHINGIGGDCPGKTELDKTILNTAKIVVEYFPQTKIEGEIQHLSDRSVYAELWELTAGIKKGRENNNEITLFDSVGFALEDFAILTFFYDLALKNNIGSDVDMIPMLKNPKDLFGLVGL